MEKTKKLSKENGITDGVIWKQILVFFFPIFIGTFFQQLYNTVDTIIVGQYVGKEALAAVGTTATIINLLVGLFVGIAAGATVVISQYFGAGDAKNVSRAVHTGIALAVVSSIILTIIGFLTVDLSLKLIDVPEDIFDSATLYLKVIYAGILGGVLYNVGTGILRAIGDSRMPLYILIVSCVVNIVLDYVFVAIFAWGVFGVALATIIAQAISAVLVMMRLMLTNEAYKVELKKIRFHTDMLKAIIKIGIPTGLQSILYSLSNVVVQASVNSFGTSSIAAWSVFGKIDGFVWMVMNAFGISITTFAGQNFGAKKYDRVKKGTRVTLFMSLAVTIIESIILIIFIGPLMGFFTNDLEVIEIGTIMVRVLAPAYFMFVFIETYSGTIRSSGEATQPMLITLFGVCVLRIIWMLTAVQKWNNIVTVSMNYPITWTITGIVFIVYYLRGNWLKRGIARQEAQEKAQRERET